MGGNSIKKFIKIIAFLAAVAFALWAYARKIEPIMLKTEHVNLTSKIIKGDVKIAVFSDTHLGNGVDTRRLNAIVEKINTLNADVVVFLGDFYDNYSKYTGDTAADTEALSRIEAPIRLAVWGNHDMGGGAHKTFPKVMQGAGFILLENGFYQTDFGVRFCGVENVTFGNPSTEALADEGMYNVLLCHEPDFGAGQTGFALQLSGHSHGGQVYLPIIGAPVLPEGARTYVRGLYEKADGVVYVTRGIGMSILPYRFGAVPEITLITLSKEN